MRTNNAVNRLRVKNRNATERNFLTVSQLLHVVVLEVDVVLSLVVLLEVDVVLSLVVSLVGSANTIPLVNAAAKVATVIDASAISSYFLFCPQFRHFAIANYGTVPLG
jgi:hypothetical protein